MEATRRSPVILLKWLVAIVIPALLFLIPVGDVFTAPIRLFFVVTLFMMIVIALELVPILMSAIFLPALYILLQIAPAETALSAWTKPLPFMLVGAFILAMGLAECGLLQRLAYGILAKTGSTYRGILLGILAASLLLTFMTSGSADTVMVAFVFGICVALKLGSSKTAAGITMVSAICCVDGCLFIFRPSNMSVLIGGAQSVLGEEFNITYAQLFIHNWPWIIALVLFAAASLTDLLDGLDEEKTARFLTMLSDLGHASPIEHASFTFGIEGVSRTLLAQITRHRIASFSVQSQRYVRLDDFRYVIPPEIEAIPEAKAAFIESMNEDARRYLDLVQKLEDGHTARLMAEGLPEKQARAKASKQANEDARFVLPNACETKMVVTMNARSLQNFFHLRCCSRAQWEIRQLAEEMLRLVYPVAPHIFRTAGPACVSGPCPEGKMCCGRTAEVRAQYAALKGEKAE